MKLTITELETFLNNLDLPTLSREQASILDTIQFGTIPTTEELYKVLIKMLNNKSPGPDSLLTEFYKHLWMCIITTIL